uniref:Small nuclear ribonucleoprotein polypeptide A' n=1 Tax=Eptatretus burgeri TaxID=7764 RepID=A0A8C4Q6S1_EPTBU
MSMFRFHKQLNNEAYKLSVIENLGATLDQFDTIDFSDNEIRKIDGFPLLKRLKNLLFNNNRVCRFAESLELSLPNLQELVLTNNNLQELGDLEPMASLKSLRYLSLMRNPVANKKHYRLYVINKLPQVRVLDFQRVKMKERQEAERLFKGKRGSLYAKDIGKKSKTFTPGAGLPGEKKAVPTPADVEAIKTAIANASTLEEVARLKAMLQAGQIPGRDKQSTPGTKSNRCADGAVVSLAAFIVFLFYFYFSLCESHALSDLDNLILIFTFLIYINFKLLWNLNSDKVLSSCSVCLSVSYFDFTGQIAGLIRLKICSNVLVLTGNGDRKARSGHMNVRRSKWLTWKITSKIFLLQTHQLECYQISVITLSQVQWSFIIIFSGFRKPDVCLVVKVAGLGS